jgi:hypothetical protein
MFGDFCGQILIENIVFYGIRADSPIIARTAGSLVMRDVEIVSCTLRNTMAMLVGEAETAEIHNLLVSRCNVTLDIQGGGLIHRVHGDAVLSRTAVILSNVLLLPDGGGSGYTAAAARHSAKSKCTAVRYTACKALYCATITAVWRSYRTSRCEAAHFWDFPITR